MKEISDIITPERIRDLASSRKDDAIVELWELAAVAPEVTDPPAFLRAIRARETAMSTGIGMGLAIPHAKIPSVTDFVIALGRSREGIDFDSLDGLPAHIVILMGASDTQASDFLKLMARIGGMFSHAGFKERFLEAKTPDDMYRLIANAD
jgi:mannitol/fructose-specific phosphotransferase system IIA component (Ntr-type)